MGGGWNRWRAGEIRRRDRNRLVVWRRAAVRRVYRSLCDLIFDLQFLLFQLLDLMAGVVDERLVLTTLIFVRVLDGVNGNGYGRRVSCRQTGLVFVPDLERTLGQSVQYPALE